MRLALLAQFLHILHQLIGQIVVEPIQEILLLANLDLDDHLGPVVELGSHIHRSGEQIILLIGHAVGLASFHNLSVRYIQLQNVPNKCCRHLRQTKNLLGHDIQGRRYMRVSFLHPCSFSIKNRGKVPLLLSFEKNLGNRKHLILSHFLKLVEVLHQPHRRIAR